MANSHTLVNNFFELGNKSCGQSKFTTEIFIINSENKVLKDNDLTIVCKISMKENTVHHNGIGSKKCLNRSTDLVELEKLLTNNQFSDVTVTTEGKFFHLNKYILLTRNPIFKVTFVHDMK